MTKAKKFLPSLMAIVLVAAGVLSAQVATNIGQNSKKWNGGPGFPVKPDQTAELAMKITQPFTIVGVGDLLEFMPFAKNNDPAIQFLVKLLQDADVTIGDFENEIYDFDNFGHYGVNLAPKEVADDWALMGIDMVSRANNKSPTAPGVWENFRQVERVGIGHVGVAKTLPEARMARYKGTAKGIFGMVGIASDGGIDACCPGGPVTRVTAAQLAQLKAMKDRIVARREEVEVPIDMPPADPPGVVQVFGVTFATEGAQAPAARPERRERPLKEGDGVKNAIRVTLFHGVTAQEMAQLRAIAGDKGAGDLAAFGTKFRVMDRPGEHSFDMDPQDLKEVLAQIRTGKQASDFLASNFHWHQNRYDFQHYSYDHYPADFEIKFAHAAIDQGVDFFLAQGVHTLKGVEIYKGKPIFYGVSNFVFQSAIMPLGKGPVPGGGRNEAPGAGESKADEIVGEHETQGFWQLTPNLESIVAWSRYEGGKLTEVRIYPVDLGQTLRVGSQLGIPKKPSPEVANKILDEVIEYSKPFGTRIVVENGVGVIRLARSTQ